jgi:endonuclease VIII
MPEGPTLHRLARDHTKLLAGRTLRVSSPQGRFAEGAKTLDGRTLLNVEAWGKHIFYDFAGNRVLHVHLGLYGKYRVHAHGPAQGHAPEPRGAVRVRFGGDAHTLDLNGPNQCEVIDDAGRQRIVARLGPDPLRPDADPDKAWRRVAASRTSVGQLLMDQAVVSGIGNIYRAELLWLVRLHPRTPGKAVAREQFDRLWADAKRLMELAVRAGRIITTDLKSLGKPASKVLQAERFNVYKKDHCPRCGGAVERYALAGRTVYACGGCQAVQEPMV